MEHKDGEPAFPRDHRHQGHNGLTMRDYFAAKAMQGWQSNPTPNDTPIDAVAAWSYRMADAMLKARKQP